MSQQMPHGNSVDLTLFVACYNEEANIVATLDTLLEAFKQVDLTWEIIIIDDASSDRSVELIEKYVTEHPELPIILKVNEVNQGLGQNFIDGAFLGHGNYYRLICGDNVEPVETLATIFKHVGEAEMIIPYHVEVSGKSAFRKFLSKTLTAIVNFISGHRIRYYNGLAVHLRYNVMRWHSNYRGFGFQADLVTRLLDGGCTYKEIPVFSNERIAGKSTALNLLNTLSVAHTLLDILIRRVGHAMYTHRARKARKHE